MTAPTSETPVTQTGGQPRRKALNPMLKFALELGPLALFFIANSRPGLFHWLVGWLLPANLDPEKVGMLTATAVLMVVTLVALAASFLLTRRLPVVPLVTAAMVLVFGSLTLWLQNKTFIQVKLSVFYVLLSAALLGSMAFGKMLLPIVFDMAFHLDPIGWRKLTLRWGLFFLALAILNEVLRQVLTWDQWAAFKTFGVLPLTLLFALSQAPLIMKYEAKDDAPSDEL